VGLARHDSLKGRRILVTGHTGFKGAWMVALLGAVGAEVTGFALPPASDRSLFLEAGLAGTIDSILGDVRDFEAVRSVVERAKPEAIVHLAAQPLVLEGYRSPVETFATNVQGTVHVLEAARQLGVVRAVAVVTTDKVYRHAGLHLLAETDALGGEDPYSASKACAEMIVETYRASYFSQRDIGVATLRAGNVLGGGDWSQDRLLPDAARAMLSDARIAIRHPDAVRPWQDVLDVELGYLHVLAGLLDGDLSLSRSWNFGPPPDERLSVADVLDIFGRAYGRRLNIAIQPSDAPENPSLLLASNDARELLGWRPRLGSAQAVAAAATFYRARAQGQSCSVLVQRAVQERLLEESVAGA
jgi:CDP-glucose 4,6-dehydratase